MNGEFEISLILVSLHLIPGALYFLALIVLARWMYKRGLPVAIPDAIASLLVLIGSFAFIINLSGVSVLDILKNQQYVEPLRFIAYASFSLMWAIGIFVTTRRWGEVLYKKYFGWFPEYVNLADHISNQARYSRSMIVTAWTISAVINSVIAPFAEEIYFRGFLLPQFTGDILLISFVHMTLFALYHFWSPWQIPTRIIAVLPMVYLAAVTGNTYIGVVMHILLNLIGDTLVNAPAVFGVRKATKKS